MADYVTLVHPNLPPDQEITVSRAAVHHYERSGWRRPKPKRDKPGVEPKPSESQPEDQLEQ